MVRMLKYNKSIKKMMNIMRMNPGITKMIKVALTVFFLVHLMTCFWYLTAKFQDFPPECWVVKAGLMNSSNLS